MRNDIRNICLLPEWQGLNKENSSKLDQFPRYDLYFCQYGHPLELVTSRYYNVISSLVTE